MDTWQRVGQLVIDSAEMVLMDRAYLEDIPENVEGSEDEQPVYTPVLTPYGLELGGILQTGVGDGTYPIEARYEDTAFGRKIAEVRVIFLPHPVLGDVVPWTQPDR
jgi:hypothetical protein